MKAKFRFLSLGVCLLFLVGTVRADDRDGRERIILKCSKPSTALKATIEGLGGQVLHEFEEVDAIVVEIPSAMLLQVRQIPGVQAAYKDAIVPLPQPTGVKHPAHELPGLLTADAETIGEPMTEQQIADFAASHPDAYRFTNILTGAQALHLRRIQGQGVVVAVMDTGIRPGFPHLDLRRAVIGGENLVPEANECRRPAPPTCRSVPAIDSRNDGHGTFVSGMIAANVTFRFSPTSGFAQAVRRYSPASANVIQSPSGAAQFVDIPMVGTAPASSIYALKVFPCRRPFCAGDGAFTSDILRAMERAIQLRRNFNSGVPPVRKPDGSFDSLNISVVNMSFGGPTLFAGRDLLDSMTDRMLAAGIVPVAAAGNAGPAGISGTSPGTALGTITAGGAETPVHLRILLDLITGAPGFGLLFRPDENIQTALFSSRGPTADGRSAPGLVANAVASFGQGFAAPNILNFASGTSFASPTIAGGAALLRQAFPTATARQIRNALLLGGNPGVIGDGSTAQDRGAGFLNVVQASALLAAGGVPDTVVVTEFEDEVAENIERVGLKAVGADSDKEDSDSGRTFQVGPLKPGQRAEFFVDVDEDIGSLTVSVADVTPELPPSQQNVLFGDDLFFAVARAKTSFGDYAENSFLTGNHTLVLANPEPGLVRVTFAGDDTNAGRISARLTLSSTKRREPPESVDGKIADGQFLVFPFFIPAGTNEADFELGWKGNWGHYPTNDLDLILLRPDRRLDFSGATFNSPERVRVLNPPAGLWLALVNGFSVPTGKDKFELSVTADGHRLRPPRPPEE